MSCLSNASSCKYSCGLCLFNSWSLCTSVTSFWSTNSAEADEPSDRRSQWCPPLATQLMSDNKTLNKCQTIFLSFYSLAKKCMKIFEKFIFCAEKSNFTQKRMLFENYMRREKCWRQWSVANECLPSNLWPQFTFVAKHLLSVQSNSELNSGPLLNIEFKY